MARKTGYMDKEVAESEGQHKEHLSWLKEKQAESGEIHKTHQAAMDDLAAETKERRKKFIAGNREYASTLGKFDDTREKVRGIKY